MIRAGVLRLGHPYLFVKLLSAGRRCGTRRLGYPQKRLGFRPNAWRPSCVLWWKLTTVGLASGRILGTQIAPILLRNVLSANNLRSRPPKHEGIDFGLAPNQSASLWIF